MTARLIRRTLQHIATHCNTLQHTATHCNTLQHTVAHCALTRASEMRSEFGVLARHTATHCNTLQHTAIHYNTLQHTATHCNTLQHTAPWHMPWQWSPSLLRSHDTRQQAATHCNICCITLQHTATHSTLTHALAIKSEFFMLALHTATHYSALQQIATHRNKLHLDMRLITPCRGHEDLAEVFQFLENPLATQFNVWYKHKSNIWDFLQGRRAQ